MKLFLISQNVNRGYDTYDSAVVAATDEEAARRIHPGDESYIYSEGRWYYIDFSGTLQKAYTPDWAPSPKDVQVKYLGVTNREVGIVLASFNAG